MKKRIVVICPGRGSYTADTLGYLQKHPARLKNQNFLATLDERRIGIGEPTLTDLDAYEKFSPALHTRGEHASTLIYASSYLDFLNIDTEAYEVVAVCGNSMGWYISLACAGVLDVDGSFHLIQTMGSMMKNQIVGGQIIYPIVDDDWQVDYQKINQIEAILNRLRAEPIGEAYVSIRLGGYCVLGGDKNGLQFLIKNLTKSGDYPFQLINHAAFHTPLLYDTSRLAQELIASDIFQRPKIPLIDGRGRIWQPYSTEIQKLYEYTLGEQVVETYDFTASVMVALKEFAPDMLCLLGPGATLGGAIGQILVQNRWKNIANKTDFKAKSKGLLITH